MKLITVPEKKFLLTTSREVSFEFIQDGYEVIHRYSKGIPGQHTRRNIAFDDIGTERNLKYPSSIKAKLTHFFPVLLNRR
ncbi:MAG: hypothetical protein Q8J84_08735 [Flavobacteriaceae bacterium]|nr:hypothetical protein [Flavobacteriaceae bacterium]